MSIDNYSNSKPPDSVIAATLMGYFVITIASSTVCVLGYLIDPNPNESGVENDLIIVLFALTILHLVTQLFFTPILCKGRYWA